MAFQQDGKLLFTTDKAKQSVKQEYSNMLFRVMETFAGSLVTSVGYNDHRPDMYVQFLLNMILDDKTRDELKEARKKDVHEATKNCRDTYDEDKTRFEVNMDYFGKCLSVYDNWIGVVKKQVILEVDEENNVVIGDAEV